MRHENRALALVLLLLLTIGLVPSSARAVPALPARTAQAAPEVASYTMEVRLDPAAKTVTGTERITYTNPSQDTLNELWMRLYLKAFSSTDSLWMQESGGQLRGDEVDPSALGDIQISSLALADGTDLLASATLTDTLLRVPLSAPLGPGASAELDVEWTSTLPRVFARTGYGGRDDTFFMVGQWYPKMAVYDRGQWDTEPWHANSEFFNDFGSYDVSITLPSEYVVAGAGVPAGEQTNADGTKTLRYTSENVTDYAFAASPDFQTESATAGDIEVVLYYLPEHGAAVDEYLDAAVGSLQFFGEWFGAYPHPRLTVVDVPDNAAGAGGMEYPTLVTGGLQGGPAGSGLVALVTAHEIGHQWWPMQTATNEGREPWLDEGITEYSGIRYMDDAGSDLGIGGLRVSAAAIDVAGYAATPNVAVTLPSWEYDGAEYGTVYSKTAVGLWTLERVVGTERFQAAMQAYLSEYRFKHPTGEEFRESLSGSLGEIDWFFAFLDGTGVIDYAVEDIANGETESVVTLRRDGEAVVPVDVQITQASGAQRTEQWDGAETTMTYSFPAADPVARVQIDPEHKLVAEYDVRDNGQTADVQAAGGLTLAGRLLFWVQAVVQSIGLFG